MMPVITLSSFSAVGLYTTKDKKHQFAGALVPQQPKDQLTLSYMLKASQRLNLFTELKFGNGSKMLAGFRLRFPQASITGYIDSKLKTHGTYTKSIEEGAINLDFNYSVNWRDPRKPTFFSMNIRMGMM